MLSYWIRDMSNFVKYRNQITGMYNAYCILYILNNVNEEWSSFTAINMKIKNKWKVLKSLVYAWCLMVLQQYGILSIWATFFTSDDYTLNFNLIESSRVSSQVDNIALSLLSYASVDFTYLVVVFQIWLLHYFHHKFFFRLFSSCIRNEHF